MTGPQDVIQSESTPQVAAFRAILAERFPFTKEIVDRTAAEFGPVWAEEYEEALTRLFPSPDALGLAARGYAFFVLDLLRRQKRFEEDRRYEAKSYEEAAAEVYLDEDFMMSQYLPGLLLSHYLWPHHYRQIRFFETAFVAPMRIAGAERFVEVGVGTGLYSRLLLQRLPGARGSGVEISPASKAFAENHVRAFDLQDRYEVVIQDVVAEELAPCEWLVCVEVLEHLEDPVTFLRALRSSLVEGGRAFITAALNAPNVDHIYLYERTDEVIEHLQAAGFALEQAFFGPAHKPVQPGVPVPSVAAFVVV